MKKTLLAALAGAMISASALAETDLRSQAENQLKSVLGPAAQVTAVYPLGEGQILEVQMTDGGLLHMTPDLGYFVYDNQLYQVTPGGAVNVTNSRMDTLRAQEMAGIPDKDTVLFKAKGEQKAVINVFTDIDCGYCQKLHREVEELNTLGITVRYLAFPRAGILDEQGQPTDSFAKINHVWCVDDRAQAMTDVKTAQGELSQAYSRARSSQNPKDREQAIAEFDRLQTRIAKMTSSDQCDSPVAAQYTLGKNIGVSGTPAIVTENGALIPGYMEAQALAARLGIN
jgi:thiol:disulfide interchange protein DsbC